MSGRLWILMAVLATPAWALPPVSVSLGYSAQVFSARSFDLVSRDDTLAMARVGLGYSFTLPQGALDLEAAFAQGGKDTTSHNNTLVSFDLKAIEAGVSYRYPLLAHLHPYVHVGAGWDWVTLTLRTSNTLTQTVNNVSGNAMVGVQVPFKLGPNDSRAPFLLTDLGVGYSFRPGAGFHAMQPAGTPNKEDPIAQASANLGTLPLSGIQYRILFTFRL